MKLFPFVKKMIHCYDVLVQGLITYLTSPLLLIIRLYMASIFFLSGWNKFHNLWDGGWFKTVFLFKTVFHVPMLSPEMAAVLCTFFELFFSVLCIAGFVTRLSALGLLGVTAVIQCTVGYHETHVLWALLLSTSLIMGPGQFSLDALLHRYKTKIFNHIKNS